MAMSKPEPLTLIRLQQQVDTWIQSTGIRYFSELTNLAQLVEEVGEVARIMSRTYGEQNWRAGAEPNELSDELGDVLFVLVCIANQTGIDLEEVMHQNLIKKSTRDVQRHRDNPKLKETS